MTALHSPIDVLIIGGGPTGMMAALSVKHHHPQYSVVIIDQASLLGRKLAISGSGRGNLTNKKLEQNPELFFHGNKELISSVFGQFGYTDTIKFFDDLGVPLYEEKKTEQGKMFPVIENAQTVRNILVDALLEKGIVIVNNTTATGIVRKNDQWIVTTHTQKEYFSYFVILTCGGKTYPALGSDGSGYTLLSSVGHTIVPPVVSAVPLVAKNPLSQILQGEKCRMRVTPIIAGEKRKEAMGEVLFTQYGLSGPAILDVSRDISIRINREGKKDTTLQLSFFPETAIEEVKKIIKQRLEKHPTLPVAHALWGLLTEKIAGAVCAVSAIPKDRIAKDMTNQEMQKLIGTLTSHMVSVTDTRGWNEGEFTAGGVDTNEIIPETLESKYAKGLFIAGEVLNVDGPVGGFNLSWSWASGWVAGKLQ